MEQGEKKNAERYAVIMRDGSVHSVWAENFTDCLNELEESRTRDAEVIPEDDIVAILKID